MKEAFGSVMDCNPSTCSPPFSTKSSCLAKIGVQPASSWPWPARCDRSPTRLAWATPSMDVMHVLAASTLQAWVQLADLLFRHRPTGHALLTGGRRREPMCTDGWMDGSTTYVYLAWPGLACPFPAHQSTPHAGSLEAWRMSCINHFPICCWSSKPAAGAPGR